MSDLEDTLYQRIKEATDLALQVSIVRTLIYEDLVGRGRPKPAVKETIKSLSPSFFIPSSTDLSTSKAFRRFVNKKAEIISSPSTWSDSENKSNTARRSS